MSNLHLIPHRFYENMTKKGVHFDTNDDMLTKSISTAVKVFVQGVEAYHKEAMASSNWTENLLIGPSFSCDASYDATNATRWTQGEHLFK